MDRITERKIILVVRKTRLEELIVRFNTLGQAKFYIEHLGADFSDYEIEHKNYKAASKETEQQLNSLGRLQVLDRAFLPNFIFGKQDMIVVLGQDGLVANTLKYLDQQPVVAINPDPKRWEGALLPFEVKDVSLILPEVIEGTRQVKKITMAHIKLNNGQQMYGVNDLFIGPKTHTSIRYQIKLGETEEQHSSSGIIVSTGLGSTGWLKSILTGTNGVCVALGKPINVTNVKNFKWDSNYLMFTVREPWPSKFSQATLVFGRITLTKPMALISQMPERGVIFSDGIEQDFLEFNSGTQATIGVADKKGCLVV
jgi:NAD kinase